jgi:ferritin-like metal-binding protein YciE
VLSLYLENLMATRKSNTQSQKQSPDGRDLLVIELQEIHSAESQLSRVLPRLGKSVDSASLREKFEARIEEGEQVLKDVDAALVELDSSPGRKKNIAAEGLINDAREHVEEIESGPALDVVLIGAMQKTEHYCIAAWGTARALAESLGEKNAVRSMDRALKEGRSYDEELTKLAEKEITPALLSLSGGEDGAVPGGRGRANRNGGERRAT